MTRKHPIEILLTTGETALIDEEDFDLVSKSNWYSLGKDKWIYAYSKRQGQNVLMHHLALGYPYPGYMIDHIDSNGLNNQRSNLRFVTNQQNQARSIKRDGSSSQFKGVCWDKAHMKWKAYIKINYKMVNLGKFDTEESAAIAYDLTAKEAFGNYARTNF